MPSYFIIINIIKETIYRNKIDVFFKTIHFLLLLRLFYEFILYII